MKGKSQQPPPAVRRIGHSDRVGPRTKKLWSYLSSHSVKWHNCNWSLIPFYYYIDKSVLVENRSLVKFIRNYIRDLSGVFSMSSLVRISMTSFPALTLLFVQKYFRPYNKKKNYTVAWRYEFYFLLVKKQYFTHSLRPFIKYCFYHSK